VVSRPGLDEKPLRIPSRLPSGDLRAKPLPDIARVARLLGWPPNRRSHMPHLTEDALVQELVNLPRRVVLAIEGDRKSNLLAQK
jgi:hypothetical protein